jgi:hypothetical protein
MHTTKITPLKPCTDCVSSTGILICGCDCLTCGATGSLPRTPCGEPTCRDGLVTLHYQLHPGGSEHAMTVHHDLCWGTGYADAAVSWDEFLFALAYRGWSWVFDHPTYSLAPLVVCSASRNGHTLITSWYGITPSRHLSSASFDSDIIDPLILEGLLS